MKGRRRASSGVEDELCCNATRRVFHCVSDLDIAEELQTTEVETGIPVQ